MDWKNIPLEKRHEYFKEEHCWQYQMRLSNLDSQLEKAGLTKEDTSKFRVSDFEFSFVSSEDKKQCKEVKEFILENEWLGRLPNRPTHRFVARLKKTGQMAGTIIMAIPNQFSNVLGSDKKTLERLISRGACISWAPKNLGSALIMYSIKWSVKNTEYRFFTSYSDPDANELGTIYQACNFSDLGQNLKADGTPIMVDRWYDSGYFKNKKGEPIVKNDFSEREFRKKSMWQKYAVEIEKNDPDFYHNIGMPDYKNRMFGLTKDGFLSWEKAKKVDPPLALKWKPNWDLMKNKYPGLKERLEAERDKYMDFCEDAKRETLPKHKYIYILGKDKRETKYLKKLFFENNPKLKGKEFNYPTERGK